jgi:hypothetical protein
MVFMILQARHIGTTPSNLTCFDENECRIIVAYNSGDDERRGE